MAVWFRHGSFAVGVDDGLIRAKDFARFTSLLSAARSVSRERDRLVAEGEAEIASLRDRTEAELRNREAAAAEAEERGYREGLERGLAEAREQWTERAVNVAWSRQQDLERQAERLSEIVSLAIDRILAQEDRAALYVRALRTVSHVMKQVPTLILRVPEAARERAQGAVDTVLGELDPKPRIEVQGDPSLAEGGCLFESELGIIDASLEVQLAAIKRAVTRAAWHVSNEAEAAHGDADPVRSLVHDTLVSSAPPEPEDVAPELAGELEFQYGGFDDDT